MELHQKSLYFPPVGMVFAENCFIEPILYVVALEVYYRIPFNLMRSSGMGSC